MQDKLNIIPVILSGGVGSRLWPKSRFNLPKQFINVWDDCLLSTTLHRLSGAQSQWCVTTSNLRLLTEKVFRKHGLSSGQVICEPEGKNTAPAIALLCRYMELKKQVQEIVGVFPADHFVENLESFNQCLRLAYDSAKANNVVTLGIIPSEASSEFGYIEIGQDIKQTHPNSMISKVISFKEKPNVEKAREFISTNRFLWNSGMFVFKVQTMIDLFKQHQPQIWGAFEALKEDLSNLPQIYSTLPNISIDYAVIEKAQNILCIPSEIGWSDVGTWDELIKYHGPEQHIILEESKGCHVVSQEKKTYGFVGVDDLIVVDTKDASLIMKKGESAKVSKIVESLKKEGSGILYATQYEERPWGNFEVMKNESHFKSKIIQVEPGERLSYQSHQKRSEHWIIVRGRPEITINDAVKICEPGEHVFIPQGAKHRVANPTDSMVEFIEIQVGEYFGEDDIQRHQDAYSR